MGVTDRIPVTAEFLAEKITYFPRQHMHTGDRLATLNTADRVARDTALQPQGIHAQAATLPKLLKPTRQPLSNALGVVVGVVVVRRRGHVRLTPAAP
jgi:hypothetical protein